MPRRRGGRPPGRAAGHRPRRAAARRPARRRRAAAHLGDDRAARRRRAAYGAGRAGVLWGDVVARAGRVGLAALHTSSPGVGVVGSSLGGGLSWYARQHGLQCSAITAVELVLADGTFVRATDDQDARPAVGGPRRRRRLRGRHRAGVRPAAGPDGVRRDARLGLAARPARADRVGRVGRRTRRSRSPASPGSSRRPTCEWLPGRRARPAARHRSTPSCSGDAEAGARSLAPLRALRPEIDTFAEVPARRIAHLQLDPQEPTAVYANSVLLDGLPAGAVEALVAAAGPGSGQHLLFVELRQLGGALARPAPARRCAGPPDGSFLVLGVGLDVGTGWSAVREDATADPGLARSPGPPARRTSRWPTRPRRAARVAGRSRTQRLAADP